MASWSPRRNCCLCWDAIFDTRALLHLARNVIGTESKSNWRAVGLTPIIFFRCHWAARDPLIGIKVSVVDRHWRALDSLINDGNEAICFFPGVTSNGPCQGYSATPTHASAKDQQRALWFVADDSIWFSMTRLMRPEYRRWEPLAEPCDAAYASALVATPAASRLPVIGSFYATRSEFTFTILPFWPRTTPDLPRD